MPNYFKTQWHRLIIALLFLVLAIISLFTSSDLHGNTDELYVTFQDYTEFIGMFSISMLWLFISVVCYHHDCIEKLVNRIEYIEKCDVTSADSDENSQIVELQHKKDKQR